MLNQTADMKLAFVGIPPRDIDQTYLISLLPQTCYQFAYPNTVVWALNYSFVFIPFPQNVLESLKANAFYSGVTGYFNVTLLDDLLSQVPDLVVPRRGYLQTFMYIPNSTGHSWFYVPEGLDLLLNATVSLTGYATVNSSFSPRDFGGLRRALYYDFSDLMEQQPSPQMIMSSISGKIGESLREVFTSLLGNIDSRWIAADTQEYRDYKVRILWLNGTGQQPPINLDQLSKSLENLMPWTSWNITITTKPADNAIDELIQNQIVELQTPINYTITLSNGTSFTSISQKNVQWPASLSSLESDPINQYFISHVMDYFNLTDLNDRSIIPVVMIQTDNDTAFGGSPLGGGVSLFPDNVIVSGFQASVTTTLGEIGRIILTGLIGHETGHWVSLSHHDTPDPRIICSMRDALDDFCAFCRDARARISFISYYSSTVQLLANNQTKAATLQEQLNQTLQLFYDWNYSEAMNQLVSIYYGLDTTPPSISNVVQAPPQNSVSPQDNVDVNATVFDDLSGVKNVTLEYTDNNVSWSAIDMTNMEGSIWNATIPAFPYGTNVTYTIVAEDNFGNKITSQELGLENAYLVVPEFPALLIPIMLALTVSLSILLSSRSVKRRAPE